jgi:hypothetical protein
VIFSPLASFAAIEFWLATNTGSAVTLEDLLGVAAFDYDNASYNGYKFSVAGFLTFSWGIAA